MLLRYDKYEVRWDDLVGMLLFGIAFWGLWNNYYGISIIAAALSTATAIPEDDTDRQVLEVIMSIGVIIGSVLVGALNLPPELIGWFEKISFMFSKGATFFFSFFGFVANGFEIIGIALKWTNTQLEKNADATRKRRASRTLKKAEKYKNRE